MPSSAMPTCRASVAPRVGAWRKVARHAEARPLRPFRPVVREDRRRRARRREARAYASHRRDGDGDGDGEGRSAADDEVVWDARALFRLGAWVGAACAFGVGVSATLGSRAGQAYFAGYVLEQSLSVDNLFVFVLIFQYFRVPPLHQKKILDYGIYSAAVLRLVVIVLGTELLQRFEPLLLVFAAVLLYSSYGILVADDGDAADGDLSRNAVVQACRKVFRVTDQYDGGRFFTVGADGVRRATPMLVALATVEVSDVVFAVDSIPAVFGVTRDPFLVYTSNLFAIASLRSLYAFVATAVEELRYLQTSVGWVLAFVGVKIVVEYAGVDVPTELSLAIVLVLLSAGVVASLLVPEPTPTAASATHASDPSRARQEKEAEGEGEAAARDADPSDARR